MIVHTHTSALPKCIVQLGHSTYVAPVVLMRDRVFVDRASKVDLEEAVMRKPLMLR